MAINIQLTLMHFAYVTHRCMGWENHCMAPCHPG